MRPAQFFRAFGEPGPYGLRGPIVFSIICGLISLILVEAFAPLDPLAPEEDTAFSLFQSLSEGGLLSVLLVALFVVIGIPLFAILGLYIGTAIQNLFVWIFVRESKGYWGTFPVMAYGVNGALLFSWVPILGLLAYVLAVYVTAIGLREMHGTTTIRAVLAALGPGIFSLALVLPALFSGFAG